MAGYVFIYIEADTNVCWDLVKGVCAESSLLSWLLAKYVGSRFLCRWGISYFELGVGSLFQVFFRHIKLILGKYCITSRGCPLTDFV